MVHFRKTPMQLSNCSVKLEPFSSYRCLNKVVVTKKKRMRKIALVQPHTFAFSCLPRGCWALMSLADHKGNRKGRLGA